MKFTADAKDLRAALEPVSKVIKTAVTIPALTCFGLRVTKTKLTVLGTDIDTYASCDLRLSGATAGSCAVRARDLLRVVPMRGEVEITHADHTLTVKGPSSTFKIMSLPLEDLYTPSFEPPAVHDVDADTLKSAFQFCAPAMSTEETRYFLCGVHVRPNPNGRGTHSVAMEATDSHRIHVADLADQPWVQDKAIIPANGVRIICGVIKGDLVKFGLQENSWRLVSGSLTLTGKTIDGTYPEVDKLFTNEPEPLFLAQASEVAEDLAPFEAGKNRKIEIQSVDDTVSVISGRADMSEISEGDATLEAVYQNSGSLMLSLKYTLDSLKSFAGDTQFCRAQAPNGAALLMVDAQGDMTFERRAMIMCVR